MSLKVKIIFGFLAVAMVVLFQGLASVIMAGKVMKSADRAGEIALVQMPKVTSIRIYVAELNNRISGIAGVINDAAGTESIIEFATSRVQKIDESLTGIVADRVKYNSDSLKEFEAKWVT